MPRANEAQFLAQVLRNDGGAVAFCQMLFRISQTLDDLIDGDQKIAGGTVISVFWQALIELPANPFYRQHEPYLRPLMAGALQDWRDSVVLERSHDHHKQTIAFVIRSQLTSVVTQCAYLVGGEEWMVQVGPTIRAQFHDETLQEYLDELGGSEPADPDVPPEVEDSTQTE